jgi:hypothetical protein
VPVLEGVLIGDTAARVSTLSDDTIVNAFVRQLRATYGDDAVPTPVNRFITR